MANVNDLFNVVYTDKDKIKQKLIELLREYEDLDNLDLTKLSFHSYLIDALSMLISDNLFYSSMAYRNNFMITADLQEAIYNWAKYLSYNIQLAQPSYVDAVIYFSKDFVNNNVSFVIPKYHKFYAGDIVFRTDYQINVEINNNTVKIKAIGDNESFYIPFESNDDVYMFPITLRQYDIDTDEFIVSSDVLTGQFLSYRIQHTDYLSELKVEVDEVDQLGNVNTYIYEQADDIFAMSPIDRKYILKPISETELEILFGNGRFGKLIPANSIIRITKYTTKGTKGVIIKGSLNSLDRVYVTVNGIQKIVDLRVENFSNGYGGRDLETPDKIKENAIRAFRSKLALTTQPNYDDFINVAGIDSLMGTKSILKRSDLKVNEIALFHSFKFATTATDYEYMQIVPTNTLSFDLPGNITYYDPYKEFYDSYNDQYYICPFAISIDKRLKFVSYIYILNKLNILSQVKNKNTVDYPFILTNLYMESNSTKTQINFKLFYELLDSSYDISNIYGYLDIKYPNYLFRADDLVLDQNEGCFKATVDVSKLRDGECQLFFRLYDQNNNKICDGGPNVFLIQKLDQIMFSSFLYHTDPLLNNGVLDPHDDNTPIRVYDIPLIEKSWWDSLNDDEKSQFEYSVIQRFMYLNLEEKRALNVRVNNKFMKTTGKIKNYFYNKETYRIIDFVETLPSNPNDGDIYVISPKTTDSNLLEHRNKIAMYELGQWIYITPQPNEIALNLSDNKKYTFTGTRWFYMDYPLRLPIDITVFVDPSFGYDVPTIQEEITKSIIEGIMDKFGPDRPIYRSDIISIAHQRKDLGVVFVELNIIEIDVLFTYNIDTDLTKQELLEYVPEYIYILPEDITVNVKYLKQPERLK